MTVTANALCLSVVALATPPDLVVTAKTPTSIPAQELRLALHRLSIERGIQIIFRTDLVGNIRTTGASGNLTVAETLDQLLGGTGLTYRYLDDNTVTIVPIPVARPVSPGGGAQSLPQQDGEKRGSGSGGARTRADRLTATRMNDESHAAEDSELEEVIVTAERRPTTLAQTPISILAMSPAQLDAQGLRSIDDLARVTPAVTFQRIGATANNNFNDENSNIAVRGIDSNAGTSTIGIYVDDTPIATRHLSFGTVNAFPALFDLERVELLRGPQGTLFGAGAEGGAIRFIAPEASVNDYSGYFRQEIATIAAGGDPSYESGAALGGPIINEALGFRLSASFRQDGGYIDRVSYTQPASASTAPTPASVTGITENNVNWHRTETLRGALKWAVTDNLTLSPSIYYQQLEINDSSVFWPGLSDTNGGRLYTGATRPSSSFDPFYVAALKMSWNLGAVELTSDTSYFSRRQHATSNYTPYVDLLYIGNPYLNALSTAYFTDRQRNYTEEVRLRSTNSGSRLSWVAGLFATNMYENTTETIEASQVIAAVPFLFTSNPGGPFTPLPGGVIYYQDPFSTTDRQIALYGQADYNITPTIKLTGGLRVASDNTSGEVYFTGPFAGGTVTAGNNSFTEHPVTPKVGLSYQPDSSSLYYASATKGYRVGGFNEPQIGADPLCAKSVAALGLSPTELPSTYQSDSLWSYELGAKKTLLNGHLQVNSSVFYIDWSNVQQAVFLDSCGLEFTENLGAAVSKGFDLEVRYRVSGLTLDLQAGYTDAYYTRTIYAGTIKAPGASIVDSGNRLAPVPWSAALSAEYYVPGFEVVKPYLRVDYQYSASQKGQTPIQDANNAGHDQGIPNIPDSKNLSLRAGIERGPLNVSVFSNNVLNSIPPLTISDDLVGSSLHYERSWQPRTIGLTATYRF